MLSLTTAQSGADALAVVTLHGHGMRPDDLAPFARSLGVAGRFHYPRGGIVLDDGSHAWWHKTPRNGSRDALVDSLAHARPEGRFAARRRIAALLADPAVVPPGARLVLAGFSQGGMLACETLLLESEVRVDALALFSSSRIAIDDWRPALHRFAGLPVLISHGRDDQELPFACGETLRDCLAGAGAQVDWLPFDGGHQMPLVVWRRFRRLLQGLGHVAA